MKTVLVTGGSGFVGSNVIPILKRKYKVLAPTRAELDVRDAAAVRNFVTQSKIDAVIHLASPSPVRSAQLDSYDRLFEDCLKIYLNFYAVRECCGKIIYSGSGAEFDKRQDICNISENDFGKSVPIDDYGRAKFIMNEMARSSENIYNLRIFGCFGPREYESKFITHAINCCLRGEPITIRQNCKFDYLYIDDYARYLDYFINNEPHFHDYNAGSGTHILLTEIAQIVADKMNNKYGIVIAEQGLNKEYTASSQRLADETGLVQDNLSIENGIDRLIEWRINNHEKTSC